MSKLIPAPLTKSRLFTLSIILNNVVTKFSLVEDLCNEIGSTHHIPGLKIPVPTEK